MTVIDLPLSFVSGYFDLIGIYNYYKIPNFLVGSVIRSVFSSKQADNLCSHPAEALAGGIDQEPLPLYFVRFYEYCLHSNRLKNSEELEHIFPHFPLNVKRCNGAEQSRSVNFLFRQIALTPVPLVH